MQVQKIEFRKEREFTTVLSDSIKFLKQNFKPLFSSIVLIIGPFILLTGLAYSYTQATITANSFSGAKGLAMFNKDYFMSLGIVYLLALINSVLLNSVVYNFMCIYNEKPAGEKIIVSEVASRVWSNMGRVLGSMAVLVTLTIIVAGILVLIGAGFVSMGVFGIILLVLLVLFGLLILGPVMVYAFSALFFVVVRDHFFFFSAFGRMRRYLSGNFWWTWLIMIVALIALSVVQLVFNLPASIMAFMEGFSRAKNTVQGVTSPEATTSVWLIVFYTIGMFLTTCSSSILHLVCGFNFLSHEEKHEGKGLVARMEEIK